MAKDTPTYDRSPKERGLHAGHGDDPTLASYLSSAAYLLSFPVLVLAAFAGHWAGWYSHQQVVVALGGLLVLVVVLAAVVMHLFTRGR